MRRHDWFRTHHICHRFNHLNNYPLVPHPSASSTMSTLRHGPPLAMNGYMDKEGRKFRARKTRYFKLKDSALFNHRRKDSVRFHFPFPLPLTRLFPQCKTLCLLMSLYRFGSSNWQLRFFFFRWHSSFLPGVLVLSTAAWPSDTRAKSSSSCSMAKDSFYTLIPGQIAIDGLITCNARRVERSAIIMASPV